MATKYLDSKRISGTTADRNGIPAVSGGWKELGRTTLGSSGDSIDVSSLADKRYLMFLLDSRSNGTAISTTWKANGSTGNEYSFRRNHDGTEGTANTQPSAATSWTSIITNAFGVGYAANKSGKEKLFLEHEVYQNTAGAGTVPTRTENAFKWTGTDVIDQLTMHNSSSGDIVSGSELVVLGWDDSDTHTTNFWEELASVNASGSSSNLSTGTFTAKKYLWIQYYVESSATVYSICDFNNDTGSTFASRYSINGVSDTTEANQTDFYPANNAANGHFFNMFVINNASNEKLCIWNCVNQNTAGAGTAPQRREGVTKWANTSDQITEMDINTPSGNWGSNSWVKVWGSD
jgi:hypothetical protein